MATTERVAAAREAMDCTCHLSHATHPGAGECLTHDAGLHEISNILNTGLDREVNPIIPLKFG